MQMTQEGMTLIKRFEGFRGTAYLCPAGMWTIGYGHTSQAGVPEVTRGMQMNETMAAEVLAADVKSFAEGVTRKLHRRVSDEQFSALVSFAYNVGLGAFRSSSVLTAVNAGDTDAVPRRLQLWVKGGGKVLPGLVRRRAAEAEMFVGGKAGTGLADVGVPERLPGKPAIQSTTVISAVVSGMAALVSGGYGLRTGQGLGIALLAGLGLVTAAWIIRERLLKSKEEGI